MTIQPTSNNNAAEAPGIGNNNSDIGRATRKSGLITLLHNAYLERLGGARQLLRWLTEELDRHEAKTLNDVTRNGLGRGIEHLETLDRQLEKYYFDLIAWNSSKNGGKVNE